MGSAKTAKRLRQGQRSATAGMEFWHGGTAGREPGSLLLSPNVTRDPASVSTTGMREARADRVYYTTDRELARAFASIVHTYAGRSAVYRVKPVGEAEVDPDYPTVGFQSAKAIVLEVVELDVDLTPVERAKRCQPYELYTDGRHIHDQTGRLQLSREMAMMGFTQEYLDATFAPWTSLESAAAGLAEEARRRAGASP